MLLRCLDLEDELDLRVEQAEAALRALGARVLEDCVAAYAASPQEAFRDRLAGVMSQWGLHDERIYAALLDTLQRTPEARGELSGRLRRSPRAEDVSADVRRPADREVTTPGQSCVY